MSLRFAATFAVLALLAPAAAHAAPNADPAAMPAGQYVIDKTHASIIGRVGHHGFSAYTFRFDRFDASYSYDPKAPTAAKLTVTIDLTSMNTGLAKADEEFPKKFLASDKFPTATFVSRTISPSTGGKGQVLGDLTLGGVTKPVTLDVAYNGYGAGAGGGLRSGFSATTTIKRSDFGLGVLTQMIGDEVSLAIEAEFTPKP